MSTATRYVCMRTQKTRLIAMSYPHMLQGLLPFPSFPTHGLWANREILSCIMLREVSLRYVRFRTRDQSCH